MDHQTNKWDVLYKVVTIAGKIAIAYIIFGPTRKGGNGLITINFNKKKENPNNADIEKQT